MNESSETDRRVPDSDSRFVGLAGLCSDGIVVCRDEVIVSANPALAEIVRRSADDLVGQPFAGLIAPELRDEIVLMLRAALATADEPVSAIPTQLIRSDDAVVGIDLSATLAAVGPVGEWVICLRPATGYEHAGSLDGDQLTQLARVHRMAVFGELAASLLHDYGQPLTAARGASELVLHYLQGRSESPALVRAAQIASDSTAAAVGQLQRMWDFVRLAKPAIQRVELSSVLSAALRMVAPVAKPAGVVLENRADKAIVVRADENLLDLAVTSLLARSLTAVRARSSGVPRISARATKTSERAEVWISHNGDPLRAEQEFIRGQYSLSNGNRSPLSLPVIRSIIIQNGGVLSVTSEPDAAGVCYRAVFPLYTDSP